MKARLNDYPNLTDALMAPIAQIMDDNIREDLHSEMAPCHPGEFLTAYIRLDASMLDVIDDYNTGN